MLKEKICADFISAFKAKETLKKDTLGVLKTRITEAEKLYKVTELEDKDVLDVIQSMIKRHEQTIALYKGASIRLDSIEDNMEIEIEQKNILMQYMPSQLSEEEITAILGAILKENPNTPQNKLRGLVMTHFKNNYNGRYDAKVLSSKI